MEYKPNTCKICKKAHVNLFDDLFHVCSRSSTKSDAFSPYNIPPRNPRKKNSIEKNNKKTNYLPKLLERKKLKEKSLSKKMKTPFDRKLNRTRWPIELKKVSKIKKKPTKKRKGKPTQKSLKKKKFSNPTFITPKPKHTKGSPPFCNSESEEEEIDQLQRVLNKYHFHSNPLALQAMMYLESELENSHQKTKCDRKHGLCKKKYCRHFSNEYEGF